MSDATTETTKPKGETPETTEPKVLTEEEERAALIAQHAEAGIPIDPNATKEPGERPATDPVTGQVLVAADPAVEGEPSAETKAAARAREKQEKEAKAAADAEAAEVARLRSIGLRYIGPPGGYVSGIPAGDLTVAQVETHVQHTGQLEILVDKLKWWERTDATPPLPAPPEKVVTPG